MVGFAHAQELLGEIGAAPDERIDLADAGLRLAAFDHSDIAIEPYRAHLAQLAEDTAEAVRRADLAANPAGVLAGVLAERHGYRGDTETYDDPQNADLMRVIDRRRGLPVALGILYIHAARAQGWGAEGVNFPAHFLVRIDAAGRRTVIDPFERGRVLETADLRELLKRVAGADAELRPEFFAPLGNRGILVRLLNNIKSRALHERNLPRALSVLERMLAVAPDEAELWHQYGIASAHLGHLADAREALETCLARTSDEKLRREAAAALDRLRRSLN